MSARIFFDVPFLYYLPQYLPVYEELTSRGVNCEFVFYYNEKQQIAEQVIASEKLTAHWVDDKSQALGLYQQYQPDWVIFGNTFQEARQFNDPTRSALLFHSSGTSLKSANLNRSLSAIGVRFVSGLDRLQLFKERFPEVEMVVVGFAKLDPFFGSASADKFPDISEYGLDPGKKTILYSPTFYPSSIANMARNWPKEFSDYNVIIKAHDFSLMKKQWRYAQQRRRLHHWGKFPNVYVADMADFSLLPFMAVADIMVSDTSSAIFEFAALDKPVVICDFIKLRWNHRGLFRNRLKKRMDDTTKIYQDIAAHASSYRALRQIVDEHIEQPGLLAENRCKYMDGMMGLRDGRVSARIADYLLEAKVPDVTIKQA